MFDWVLNAHLNIVVSFIGVSVNNDSTYDTSSLLCKGGNEEDKDIWEFLCVIHRIVTLA